MDLVQSGESFQSGHLVGAAQLHGRKIHGEVGDEPYGVGKALAFVFHDFLDALLEIVGILLGSAGYLGLDKAILYLDFFQFA